MTELLVRLRAEWDRALGWSSIGLGAVCLLLGYRGVSNSVFVAKELAYVVSGGLGGLFLLGLGIGLLLSADLRDEWHKLDRIEAAIRACAPTSTPAAADNGATRATRKVTAR